MDTQQQGAMEYTVVDKTKKKQKGNKQQNVSCSTTYVLYTYVYTVPYTYRYVIVCALCKYLIMSTCTY